MTPSPHFLNIPAEAARNPKAPFAVLPVPYERTVSYGTGTALGPSAILTASHETEDFDEELQVPVNVEVQTLPPVKLARLDEKEAMTAIKTAALPVMRAGRFLLSLGGEHSISAPLISAAREAFGPLSVLHIDAHLDLRDKYRGTSLSHACVMRRVRETGTPTVHVAIRSCSAEEAIYVKHLKIPVFWAKDICLKSDDISWINKVIGQLGRKVYLSIDIDGLDPSFVPGTGTPEPGGLSWHQITSLVSRVVSKRNVVAADIVETAPIKGSQVSEFVAARLGLKILLHKQLRR